jgi:PST family polysaccharide transporter
MLYMRIDQVMLGQMLGDHAVGIFSAAVRVSELWYFVPMAMLSAVTPALTAAHHAEEQDYRRKLMRFIGLMFWMGVAVAVVLMLASGPLIRLLYGSAYSEAAPVLAIHAWAGVFASVGVATSPWFVNRGLLKLKMVYTLIGAFANVALNSLIIPRFEVVGAAVSTLISYGLVAVLLNALNPQTRPVFQLQARAILLR